MPRNIPKIEASNKFNFITSIWIVPIIALIIAGWLAYKYFSELGPEIRILFPTNEGLKAGQSYIKYKDVPIGVIKKIELQEDGDGVVVVVRMDKTSTPYINEHSRFWIVKPEVGITGVSGLDTIISGTYIDMYTQKGGKFKDYFVGLEQKYRNISGGEYFVLNSIRGESSVKVGTPVYLKNVKVGQVEYVVLSLDETSVDVIVYIDKNYAPLVKSDSRFWVRSSLDAEIVSGNLDVKVAPLIDIIQGAIEFSATKKEHGSRLEDGFVFQLYKNKNAIESQRVGDGGEYIKTFLLKTENTIAKLKENAAVRYEGFTVGRVRKIGISYQKETHKMQAEVWMDIDTSVFKEGNASGDTGEANLYQAVKEGLRAQIVPSDPFTGSLYVDLVFTEDSNKTLQHYQEYTLFPSIEYQGGDFIASATKILDKINNLPVEELLASLEKLIDETAKPVVNANTLLLDLRKSIKDINKMTNKKTFAKMPDDISRVLYSLESTLKSAKKILKGYDTNALMMRQLTQTLKSVSESSLEMKHFLRMLNKKPNSLIFGDH